MLLLSPRNVFLASAVLQPAMAYQLVGSWDGNNWRDGMFIESGVRNNYEFVDYLSEAQAQFAGLLETQNGKLILRADSRISLDPSAPGRHSVRLRTKATYNNVLVIGDFDHMPKMTCGVWPAFWMVGPKWPQDGEIDIIEAVNEMPQNQITLHTSPGCVPGVGPEGQSGARTGQTDCGAGNGDVGCGVFNTAGSGMGDGFNGVGGGVYATQWTNEGVKTWQWTKGNVPFDVLMGNPNPAGWGQPVANWVGCAFNNYLRDMSVIVQTTFCGGWAGQLWDKGSCAGRAPTCNEYVARNPGTFSEAYWVINSIKIYQ
ncbi:endo-1,3(4)-beta-glucanase-like protein [Trichodelitschia bisporula]|uniref:Endo-1,3(4)-beta-glucanase-like protein n=1 Tax=Trichodelitschia bisporula TaxID=703511 RepID=A0A6G1HLG2_9PEZI|nr:endo-1,3(4)-beta-glucanase-like protein [Trichodelitschia bisporula]